VACSEPNSAFAVEPALGAGCADFARDFSSRSTGGLRLSTVESTDASAIGASALHPHARGGLPRLLHRDGAVAGSWPRKRWETIVDPRLRAELFLWMPPCRPARK